MTGRQAAGARQPRTGLARVALPWLCGALVAIWALPTAHAAAVVAALAAAGLAGARALRRAWPLWLVAGLIWTWLRIGAQLDDRLAPALAGRDVELSGWVDGFPRRLGEGVGFSLAVLDAGGEPALPRRLRLTWYDPPVAIAPGTSLDLTVRLKPPHGLANPGGFDYERWLFAGGYGATGYVRDGRISRRAAHVWSRAWLQARGRLGRRIGEAVASPDARALLTALAIGERSAFEERHWRVLRRTGTSHLVAISGLHVGIVGALLFVLVRRLWLRWPAALAVYDLEAAAALSFAGAAGYSAMAGFSVPTQRALIMLAVALVTLVSRRTTTMVAGLGAAALFVLIRDPLCPLSASFWLSFAAVAILWQIGSARAVRPRPRWRALLAACRTQWGITLGLVPIVALYFGEISVVSVAVNLVAIPLFGLLLVPLTLAATLALAIEPLGSLLFACAARVAQWSYLALAWIADADWASLPVPGLGGSALLLLFAGAACALPAHALPGRYLGWLAMLAAVTAPAPRPARGGLQASVLDVGHGLAVVVRTHAHNLLYDTGARYRSGFDTGRDIVVPALRRFGIAALDAVVVSHADNDHAGGLSSIIETVPSERIVAGPDLQRGGADRCRRGQSWVWDGVTFEILHPPATFPEPGNDSSCVLRISAAGKSLLLTGDLEARGERALLASGRDVRADAVVVPHHGSATSSSASLVARVGARYAIVSSGYRNRWGFPKPAVRARWAGAGARMITTADAGAIEISIDPDTELAVDAERWRRHRWWHAEGD